MSNESVSDQQKVIFRSDDVELRPLTECQHVERANSLWAKIYSTTLPYAQRIAKYNPSVGAFKKDGNLVSWALL